MAPKLSGGIDHVHVYTSDRRAAEAWYESVLGFERAVGYEAWADDPAGPLVIQDPDAGIHLALFEADKATTDTIAFGASGAEFMAWKEHLEGCSIELQMSDHQMSCSMYFSDPDGNVHEITTNDPEYVRARLP